MYRVMPGEPVIATKHHLLLIPFPFYPHTLAASILYAACLSSDTTLRQQKGYPAIYQFLTSLQRFPGSLSAPGGRATAFDSACGMAKEHIWIEHFIFNPNLLY